MRRAPRANRRNVLRTPRDWLEQGSYELNDVCWPMGGGRLLWRRSFSTYFPLRPDSEPPPDFTTRARIFLHLASCSMHQYSRYHLGTLTRPQATHDPTYRASHPLSRDRQSVCVSSLHAVRGDRCSPWRIWKVRNASSTCVPCRFPLSPSTLRTQSEPSAGAGRNRNSYRNRHRYRSMFAGRACAKPLLSRRAAPAGQWAGCFPPAFHAQRSHRHRERK